MKIITSTVAILAMTSSLVFAAAHSMAPMVEAKDRDVSNGVVGARMVKGNRQFAMCIGPGVKLHTRPGIRLDTGSEQTARTGRKTG